MKNAFLSYAREDGSHIADFFDTNLNEAGFDVYRDKRGIEPGALFEQEILRNIQMRHLFIILLTPAARASTWVKKEINEALKSERWILTIWCDENRLPPKLKKFDSPKLGHRRDWWRTLHKVAELLEDKNAPVPRVVNLSGKPVGHRANAKRVLILDTAEFKHVPLHDPASLQQEAYRLASIAAPAIEATRAGIIPPGHPVLAMITLAVLQGWKNVNQLPTLYWFCNPGKTYEIDEDLCLSLQAVRDQVRAAPNPETLLSSPS